MNIIGDLVKELSPFQEYLQYMENKAVDGKTKVLPADLIQCELFYLIQLENQAYTQLVKTLGEKIAKIWIKEFEDPKKAILYHLSSAEGKCS